MYKDFLYLNIETASKSPSLMDLRLDDEVGFDLFTKKCEKSKQYPGSDWSDKPCNELYDEKASLLPEFGKIICISFGAFKADNKHIMSVIDDDEKQILLKISNILNKASNKKICGFNIKHFDIPWIVKKMYKYDIEIPKSINFIGLKPWEINVIDILEIWKSSTNKYTPIEEIAYDLNIEIPKDIITGEKIHEIYWFKKNIKSIMEKCENDINTIIRITEKINL